VIDEQEGLRMQAGDWSSLLNQLDIMEHPRLFLSPRASKVPER
jgi:hypothetical protein